MLMQCPEIIFNHLWKIFPLFCCFSLWVNLVPQCFLYITCKSHMCACHTNIYSIDINFTMSPLHSLLMSPISITLQTACLSASHELEISGLVLYSHTLSQFGMSSVNIFIEKLFCIPILASLVDLIKYNKTHNIVKLIF